MGKNEEVAKMAQKVMKKLKEEVEETRAENCRSPRMERKENKMTALCRFLEDELRQCSKGGGVTMADSVETLGVGFENESKEFGSRRKSEKEEAQGDILA